MVSSFVTIRKCIKSITETSCVVFIVVWQNVTHIDSVGGQLRIRQEEIRARVFQPGYNLPTMTLDEYATMEMRAAKEAEERSRWVG